MATKRKRTKESNKAAAPATDAVQPVQPGASGRVTPRKRTDVPAKATRSFPGLRSRDEKTPVVNDSREEAPAASEPREEVRDAKPHKERRSAQSKPHKRRWPLIVVGIVLGLILVVAGIFSWDRWLRYDDVAELQGEWQTHGTTAVVVIDGETIKLAEDVAYAYTLDTGAKTITFKFGNMEGAGRYRFSLDRSQLVITDGDSYSWLSTLVDDIAWQFDQFVRSVQDQPQAEPPSNDEATVLDRLSHDTSASPQTGIPVVSEPEPEPTPSAPETAAEPEAEAEAAPAATPESAADNASGTSDASKNDSGSGTSGTSGDVFDVSDLPA